MNSLETIWRDLEHTGQASAHRRVDAVHPLDLYVGIDGSGTRELVLVADSNVLATNKRFRAFEVTTSERPDGRVSLAVKLRRPEAMRLFAHLCEDLVEASRTGCTRADAFRFVTDRINRWEQLLSRDREGLLTEEALRGLVGELIFLRDVTVPAKGVVEGLHSWRGPLGAPHDFQYADRAVEVKTVSDNQLITISSLEQLEAIGEPLFLATLRLVATTERTNAFSVTDLVRSVQGLLDDDMTLQAELEDKLALYGYSAAPEYDSRLFVLKEVRYFAVEDGFPRILPSAVPAGIESVKYVVDLHSCESFRRQGPF